MDGSDTLHLGVDNTGAIQQLDLFENKVASTTASASASVEAMDRSLAESAAATQAAFQKMYAAVDPGQIAARSAAEAKAAAREQAAVVKAAAREQAEAAKVAAREAAVAARAASAEVKAAARDQAAAVKIAAREEAAAAKAAAKEKADAARSAAQAAKAAARDQADATRAAAAAASALRKEQEATARSWYTSEIAAGRYAARLNDIHAQALRMNADFDEARNRARGFTSDLDGMGNRARGVLNLFVRLAALAAATFLTRQLIEYSDSWKLVEGRLKLVTDSSEDLTKVQSRLFQIAQNTRSSYDAVANTYARVARNADQLGKTQDELLQFTETVSKAIQTSGATAGEAASGMLQLSQALASNTLRGDELRSVLENLPGVARALAQGLGVPLGKIRELSEAGQLTGKMVVDAILKMRESVERDFASVPKTIGGAFQTLSNETQRFVVAMDKATDASGSVIKGLRWIQDHLPEITSAVVALTKAWIAYHAIVFGVAALEGIWLFIKAIRAATDATAKFAVITSLLGGVGGMVKLVALIGAAGLAWYAYKKTLGETTEALEKLNEEQNKTVSHSIPSLIQNVIADAIKGGGISKATPVTTTTLSKELTDQIALSNLEVQRQRALQQAYGDTELAIAKINAVYDVRRERLQNEKEKTDEVRNALNRNAEALARLSVALVNVKMEAYLADQRLAVEDAKRLAAATAQGAAALDNYSVSMARVAAGRKVLAEGGTAAQIQEAMDLAEQQAILAIVTRDLAASDKAAAQALEERRKKMEDFSKELDKQIQKETDESTKETARQIEEGRKAEEAARRYSQDIRQIFREGIGKILTDGLKSWQDFFEDVFQLFAKLMKKMEDAREKGIKINETVYRYLGYGSAAIVGATSGYQSASPIVGAVSGAAAGASIAGAAGAVIGGVAGFVGGLFGQAKKARDAAREMEEAAARFQDAVEAYIAQADGLNEGVAGALRQVRDQYEELVRQAQALAQAQMDARPVWDYENDQEAAQKLADTIDRLSEAFEKLKQKLVTDFLDNLQAQLNELTGSTYANQLSAINRQFQETRDQIEAIAKDYPELIDKEKALAQAQAIAAIQRARALEAEKLRVLDIEAARVDKFYGGQIDAAQEILDVQREQLRELEEQNRTAQEAAKNLRAIADNTQAFANSLRLTNPSLPPVLLAQQQRAALDALYGRAQAGDQKAAQEFVSQAQQYLQTLQQVYGSTRTAGGERSDVQAMADALAKLYGDQATSAETTAQQYADQIDALKEQVEKSEKIIEVLEKAREAEADEFAAQREAIQAQTQATVDAIAEQYRSQYRDGFEPQIRILTNLHDVGLKQLDTFHGFRDDMKENTDAVLLTGDRIVDELRGLSGRISKLESSLDINSSRQVKTASATRVSGRG